MKFSREVTVWSLSVKITRRRNFVIKINIFSVIKRQSLPEINFKDVLICPSCGLGMT